MNKTESKARPVYSAVRSGIISLTPSSIQCKLYCGGNHCKYCTVDNWTDDQQAIKGLYSHWITDNIVAMARPTRNTFEHYNFVNQLKILNIRSVINMQTIGEHAFCGPVMDASGFSYSPELLMENNIYFYNFAFPDFGVQNIETLLDVVKVIQFAITQGNIAIHCHAGLGRTGVVIAAYLVWAHQYTSTKAIEYVRLKRPNSVQSMVQINAIDEFWQFLKKIRIIPKNGTITLNEYLTVQRKIISTEEARRYDHIPKIIQVIFENILAVLYINSIKLKLGKNSRDNSRTCSCNQSHLEFVRKVYLNGISKRNEKVYNEIKIYFEHLITKIDDLENENQLNIWLKDGFLNMVNQSAFFRDKLYGRVRLALYIINRFMDSFKKPIADRKEILKAFTEHPIILSQAWQCLLRYLMNAMSLLCVKDNENAVKLLIRWFIGNENENDDELENLFKKCMEYFWIDPSKVVDSK